MRRRDPSSLFRSVLLLSAVGTACGGAVETVGTYPAESSPTKEPETNSGGSSTSSSGFTSSSGGSTSSSGGSTSSSGGSSGGSSGASSGGSSGASTSSSGGPWECKTGKVAMTDAYCCPDGGGGVCNGGGGDALPDGGVACAVDCRAVCDSVAPGVQGGFENCWLQPDGTVSYYCGACGVGRLPSDTKPCAVGTSVAEHLARQAYYEGVSVVAFERLADVLRANGAPARLVARARRAAADEARHAAVFTDLARAYGATVPAIDLGGAVPSLLDLAIENATEGCVRETLGAAITLHQSRYAESPEVRAAFASICDDEAEHAAFSWDLKAWFDLHLCREDRARVEEAHRIALEVARAATSEAPDATGLALGLPSPARTRRMLDLAVEALAA